MADMSPEGLSKSSHFIVNPTICLRIYVYSSSLFLSPIVTTRNAPRIKTIELHKTPQWTIHNVIDLRL